MRSLPFLLIAGFALVLMTGETDAEVGNNTKAPLWSSNPGAHLKMNW